MLLQAQHRHRHSTRVYSAALCHRVPAQLQSVILALIACHKRVSIYKFVTVASVLH